MQNTFKTLVAVCTFSMVAGIARGNLITNSSFETPTVAAGGFTNYATGSSSITGVDCYWTGHHRCLNRQRVFQPGRCHLRSKGWKPVA